MIMPKKLTTAQFIDNAKDIHGNRYDYTKSIYQGTRDKVIVLCKTHGEFVVTPNDHISKQSGCPKCSGKKKHTNNEFIEKANKVHSDEYDYSLTKYKNLDTKVKIICNKHGEFEQTGRAHIINKQGCPECGKIKTRLFARTRALSTEQFISKACEVHNDEYDYSKVNYINNHIKVKIICKKHGEFEQAPDNHINGKQGCPICGHAKKGGTGGYTEQLFENNPEKKKDPAILYIIRIIDGNNHYIKVGITTRSVAVRFARTDHKDMVIIIINEKYLPLYEAFLLEQKILTEHKDQQYWPTKRFGGFTECIKDTEENVNTIIRLMEQQNE
jgi:hypothetical protein